MMTSANNGDDVVEGGIITDADGVEHYRVLCSENLDISMADQLQSVLLKAVDSGLPVELAVAEVARVDTAVLQVFCAFCQNMSANARNVIWMESSESLHRAAELLGLSERLGLLS